MNNDKHSAANLDDVAKLIAKRVLGLIELHRTKAVDAYATMHLSAVLESDCKETGYTKTTGSWECNLTAVKSEE